MAGCGDNAASGIFRTMRAPVPYQPPALPVPVSPVVRDDVPLESVPAAAWDALTGGQPLLSHAFLAALHATGCASPATGWRPHYLTAWSGRDLVGALPLYAKTHSYGEYVFDWGWADAYRRYGRRYYPKLVAAIPFTPVPGPRLLSPDPATRGALLDKARALVADAGYSSLHVLFVDDAEAAEGTAAGGKQLIGVQRIVFVRPGLPAEQFAVEGKRLFSVCRKKLLPAHPPGLICQVRARRAAFQPANHAEGRRLRVSDDGYAADVAVGRRYEDRAAQLSEKPHGSINVVDGDVADPAWRRTHSPRIRRKLHQPANLALVGAENGVGKRRRRSVLCLPSDHVSVKRACCGCVCGQEFVPGELSLAVTLAVTQLASPFDSIRPNKIAPQHSVTRVIVLSRSHPIHRGSDTTHSSI